MKLRPTIVFTYYTCFIYSARWDECKTKIDKTILVGSDSIKTKLLKYVTVIYKSNNYSVSRLRTFFILNCGCSC